MLLCLLLVDLFLIANLLVNRGEVTISDERLSEYEQLTSTSDAAIAPTDVDDTSPRRAADVVRADQGLRATVWAERHRHWAPALGWLCRHFPPLNNNFGAFASLIVVAVLLGLLRSLFLSRARTLAARTALDIVTRTRKTLHRQTLRLGPSDLQDRNSNLVYHLFTIEAETIFNWVNNQVARLSRHPFEIAVLLLLAVQVHWLLAIQCLIPLGVCWYLVDREKQRFQTTRRLAEDRSHLELKLLAEGLQKTRLVRGYGMEAFEHQQFEKYLDRFRDNRAILKRGETWSRWLTRMLIFFCLTIILGLVGSKVLLLPEDPSHLSFPAALLLLTTFAAMVRPLDNLRDLGLQRENAALAADKIFRYINEIPEVGQAVGAKFLQPLTKSLQFEAVTYGLPHANKLLNEFNLKLTAGESTALISFDPLEAQTAAYLLPRFIEPQSGRILFDGEDTAWVTLESLRAETIYVGGADPFFTGTVSENISCGNADYSFQDITEAAKKTHAHNFILRLPQGYETVLGEHGEQPAPGEGFRLGLARAVLRNPALIIIEEPNSPLDEDTKPLLEDAYNRMQEGRTLIFLPSRLATLRRADRIVLINRGKVEAIGTHSNLLKTSPLYRHWEYIRFNEYRSLVPTAGAE